MSTAAWLATSFLMLARGDQQAESLDSLAAPLRPTRRRMYKAWFLYGRSNFPGLGARGVTEQVKYEMTMRGQATWEVGGKRIAEPKERRPEPVNVGQVASPRILELLLHRDGRPVWTAALWKEHASRLAAGHSLSPPHYPHSSEDLALAWDAFARPFKAARWAVWSSISPWVESKLFGWGATKVTTVDYNPPHVDDGPEVAFTGAMLQILDQATLADAYAANAAAASSTAQSLASGLFDVVVSFSGVEHDGLGRYGDPVNPEGDLAASRGRPRRATRNLAIPTCGWPLVCRRPCRRRGRRSPAPAPRLRSEAPTTACPRLRGAGLGLGWPHHRWRYARRPGPLHDAAPAAPLPPKHEDGASSAGPLPTPTEPAAARVHAARPAPRR